MNKLIHYKIVFNCKRLNTFKCLATEDWLNKLWYIHITEYYIVRKKKKGRSYCTDRELRGIKMKNKITK